MRNISLSDFETRRINELNNCEVFTYDCQCFYACEKGIVIKIQENKEQIVCDLTSLYPVPEKDDIPKALLITHSYENFLYLVLCNGDIISVDVNVKGSETVIGSVDSGVKAAQWSPEQDVIAIVTGIDTVLVMTRDFEAVSEVDLHSNDFGEKQFITVGWGKKETQFRGSEGKFNAKQNQKEEIISESDSRVKISWRDDGEYFAVSSINPESGQRYLRIYNQSGILQYTSSENLNGLEHCLDWRPSGNLIASTQKLPNKYNVCFFEKNGLKHNEFTLPVSHNEIRVDELQWNKDSRILALLITKISSNNSTMQNDVKYIQLFTVSNYHWYCKYTINFNSKMTPIMMQWDYQKYNTLHVVVSGENFICHNKYSWLWVTNKSKGTGFEDESFVAVIDGCNLQLTSFRREIKPPPLYTYAIHAPVPINSLSFAPNSENSCSSDLLLHLSNGNLLVYIFKISKNDPKKINHELVGEIESPNNEIDFHYNFLWVAPKSFVCCLVRADKTESKPFLSIFGIEDFTSAIVNERKEIPLLSTVAILRASKSIIIIHDNGGRLYSLNAANNELLCLYPDDKKSLIELEVRHKDDENFIVFRLDNFNKFYMNEKLVFNSVLSFHIHEEFILLTNLKHELLCINFKTEIPNNDLSEIFVRRVERGSRLVTSVSRDMKVVLQMPRGNLECIQPRALSLHVISKYLDSLKYYEAFDLMRKQRINLNLLYDHDPMLFSKNLTSFVEQIKDSQWISLFISDLCDEDVTKTMYSVMYKNKKIVNNEIETKKSKIDVVCDMVEKALIKNGEITYKNIFPILTCHIKRKKIEYLEKVLLILKELKPIEEKKKSLNSKLAVSFDEAFKYILYFIDVEELYKIALGMYDLDLALMIANKSQKDPREYLPFLNFIKREDTSYQKFTIDDHLKRYKKALKSLILRDDEFNESLSYIEKHDLYKFALTLIPKNTDKYKSLCACYAEKLMKSHMYEEAGIMYAESEMFKKAIEAYSKSRNWREVVSFASELNLGDNELHELYLEVAIDLSESKHFQEAATVYLDYLKDVEECVTILSKGKLFSEAHRICYLHDRKDLINQLVIPAILEHGDLLKKQISSYGETFTTQKNRLKVVRKQKQEAAEKKFDFDADNDAYSESSTVITQSYAGSHTTNRTYRSAKNKRKHERKLLSLKEGSPFEDLALVASLHNLVTNCISLKCEVKEVNKFLIKIKFDLAENLQHEFDELLKKIESSKSEIWIPELLNNKHEYGPTATSNEIAATFMKSENIAPPLLDPKLAIPPDTQNNVKWQLEILKPS